MEEPEGSMELELGAQVNIQSTYILTYSVRENRILLHVPGAVRCNISVE